MQAITIRNEFHNTEATIRPREDGTISAATYRRARRELCGISTCRCFSSSASGGDVLILGQAEPIYGEGFRVTAYRLPSDNEL